MGNEKTDVIFEVKNFSVFYNSISAVCNVSVNFKRGLVTAVIGPSGCGKSTLLRSLNRMNDFIPGISFSGEVFFLNKNLYSSEVDPVDIRRKIGMVFQKPNPFPKSIYNNIIWGPQINGFNKNGDELVETSLKKAALWDEVKDRLHDSALALSGGQQQRLCIARALAMEPEVILMDEPCSALDPKATARIEDLIGELSGKYTIVIVTHNMQQAARVSADTVFMYEGDLIENGLTSQLFTKPNNKKTEDYITGRFG